MPTPKKIATTIYSAAVLGVLCAALLFAGSTQTAHSFTKSLAKDDQIRHALDRLTFGPRPGDFERVKKLGLKRWLTEQLHPEKAPENVALTARLRPFQSLNMDVVDMYHHYPPPQLIRAVARGNAPLPDDPELRAVVLNLSQRYLRKQQNQAGIAPNPNSDNDLDLRTKLSDVLSPGEIDILKNGKPEEKRTMLASIPANKRSAFVCALRQEQRRQLFALAPVELRRDLMLSVNPQLVVTSDLTESKLLRAVYSNHQLQELLVDFWYNHFNVFIDKGADRFLVPAYERDAIRPHVFGKFYDLLLATAENPAMLFYLDNWQSVAPGSDAPNRKIKRGLNENYGRELLELHTLGVDGGYTQKDVIEVARCFTGWTIARPAKGGSFEYRDKFHDKGQKIVLGHTISAGGGMNDGLKVLNILAHEPATAHFISLKLAQRFVADNPPPALVNRMTQAFLKTDGDLREVMRTMIAAKEFWSEGAYQAKIKSPLELVVSALRATDADVSSAFVLSNIIQKLGEPLYRKIEPTGYSNTNADWVSSAGLLDRMNFAIALTHNRIPGVSINTSAWQSGAQRDPMNLARLVLETEPSPATRQAIQKALANQQLQEELTRNAKAGPPQIPSLIAGLAIGSPDFQRR